MKQDEIIRFIELNKGETKQKWDKISKFIKLN